MIEKYSANERGYADHGWLQTYHSFSFASYYDPSRMGFGALRVINDDTIAPGKGFGTHPHQNMEIITIPLSGALAHKDSMGNASTIQAGEVQYMSAGSGVSHSEWNASTQEPVSLLQIWILPQRQGGSPKYDQKKFQWQSSDKPSLLISPDGREESIAIGQDAFFTMIPLSGKAEYRYECKKSGNASYIFAVDGEISVMEQSLQKRDAVEITDENQYTLIAKRPSQILIIEVPLEFEKTE
ncbi:MAG: pirin family protein [Bdellovibrionales bacterium]|nr:pirin family protein [Bdellovibrionales bacterium]